MKYVIIHTMIVLSISTYAMQSLPLHFVCSDGELHVTQKQVDMLTNCSRVLKEMQDIAGPQHEIFLHKITIPVSCTLLDVLEEKNGGKINSEVLKRYSIQTLGAIAHAAEYLDIETLLSPVLQKIADQCAQIKVSHEEGEESTILSRFVAMCNTSVQDQITHIIKQRVREKLPDQPITLMAIEQPIRSIHMNKGERSFSCDIGEEIIVWNRNKSSFMYPKKDGEIITQGAYKFFWEQSENKVSFCKGDNQEYEFIWKFKKNDVIHCVVVSPQQALVAIGVNNELAVRETEKLKRVYSLQHNYGVCTAAFSPNEKLVATGSDCMARIWDNKTKRLLHEWKDRGLIYSITFNPDGTLVAIGSSDCTAKVWNYTKEECMHRLEHNKLVFSVIFNSDGKEIITGSYDDKKRGDSVIKSWNVPVLNILQELDSVEFIEKIKLYAQCMQEKLPLFQES